MEKYTRTQIMQSLDNCFLMYGAGMTKKQLLVHVKMLHASQEYYNTFFNKKAQMDYFKSL
jgi:hypothetical protein